MGIFLSLLRLYAQPFKLLYGLRLILKKDRMYPEFLRPIQIALRVVQKHALLRCQTIAVDQKLIDLRHGLDDLILIGKDSPVHMGKEIESRRALYKGGLI